MTNPFDEHERDYLIAKITTDIGAIKQRIKERGETDTLFSILLDQLIMLENLLRKIQE